MVGLRGICRLAFSLVLTSSCNKLRGVHVPSVLFNRPCEKGCFQSDFTALILFLHVFYCFLLSILYYFSLFPIFNPSLPLICPPGLLFCDWWALSHEGSFFCHGGLTDEFFSEIPWKLRKPSLMCVPVEQLWHLPRNFLMCCLLQVLMCTGAVAHLDKSGRELCLHVSSSLCVDQVYQMSWSPGSVLSPTACKYNVGEPEFESISGFQKMNGRHGWTVDVIFSVSWGWWFSTSHSHRKCPQLCSKAHVIVGSVSFSFLILQNGKLLSDFPLVLLGNMEGKIRWAHMLPPWRVW